MIAGAAIVWLVGEVADWHGAGFVLLGCDRRLHCWRDWARA